jgi:hypothetical protein
MKNDRSAVPETVYAWMKSHADGDGFVSTSSRKMQTELGVPNRTVSSALARLERQGRVFLLCRGNQDSPPRYAVKELAADYDE